MGCRGLKPSTISWGLLFVVLLTDVSKANSGGSLEVPIFNVFTYRDLQEKRKSKRGRG